MRSYAEILDEIIFDALSKVDAAKNAWAKAIRTAEEVRQKLYKKYGVESLGQLPDSELDAVERIEFLVVVLPIETAMLEAYRRTAEEGKPCNYLEPI